MFSFCKRGGKSSSVSSGSLTTVGWVMNPDWEATFIWSAPRKVTKPEAHTSHAKGVSVCPAILDHEARLFEVVAPVDIHLRPGRDQQGKPVLLAVDGEQSTIRLPYINKLMSLMPQEEWRHPNRPILQVSTPFYFVADEPVYITTLPAFYHYHPQPQPGLALGGRFPIHIWPRQLIWAFEWYDPTKDLIINRGDPWFYLNFETDNPSGHVRLIEAEMTPKLKEYIGGLRNVTAYVNRTFSLFKMAAERRPKTLLTPKVRDGNP